VAKLVYGLNQSLDGYVDHDRFGPSPKLFRHFIEQTRQTGGSVYGRVMYGLMRYWDDEQPDWGDDEREYATEWQANPKWVVSRTLKPDDLGPNAELVSDNVEGFLRKLKAERDGEIEIAGTVLAQHATELGLIDEYRIWLHPVVLGQGKPYFAGTAPALRLVATEQVDDNVLRLSYVRA
jgi:dihydrofolate reductase